MLARQNHHIFVFFILTIAYRTHLCFFLFLLVFRDRNFFNLTFTKPFTLSVPFPSSQHFNQSQKFRKVSHPDKPLLRFPNSHNLMSRPCFFTHASEQIHKNELWARNSFRHSFSILFKRTSVLISP